MLSRTAFLDPAFPKLKPSPPAGPEWLHEVKFDGFRAQLHLDERGVTIYSRNGHEFTRRFQQIAKALPSLLVQSVVLDAEVVRLGEDGLPDFRALMGGNAGHPCAYCFDLLVLDGEDQRDRPLIERKVALQALLTEAGSPDLRYSDDFSDPASLLSVAEQIGLEGIVSKQRDSRYLPGTSCGWVKVKTQAWRAANRDRYKIFERRN